MLNRILLPGVALLLLATSAAACGEAQTDEAASQPVVVQSPTAAPAPAEPTQDSALQDPGEVPGPSVPAPVATSRGPNLEATAPTGVRLDAGTPQLVEFFRFT